MKTGVRNLAIFGLVGTLSCFSLAGCGNASSNPENKEDEVKSEQIVTDEEKYFDVGEHMFFERYWLTGLIDAEDIDGGSITIPDGYSVYTIENFTKKYGNGSETGGYDVWFVNDEPVEAKKVYNESLETYDYSEPGTPVKVKEDNAVQKVK